MHALSFPLSLQNVEKKDLLLRDPWNGCERSPRWEFSFLTLMREAIAAVIAKLRFRVPFLEVLQDLC